MKIESDSIIEQLSAVILNVPIGKIKKEFQNYFTQKDIEQIYEQVKIKIAPKEEVNTKNLQPFIDLKIRKLIQNDKKIDQHLLKLNEFFKNFDILKEDPLYPSDDSCIGYC